MAQRDALGRPAQQPVKKHADPPDGEAQEQTGRGRIENRADRKVKDRKPHRRHGRDPEEKPLDTPAQADGLTPIVWMKGQVPEFGADEPRRHRQQGRCQHPACLNVLAPEKERLHDESDHDAEHDQAGVAARNYGGHAVERSEHRPACLHWAWRPGRQRPAPP